MDLGDVFARLFLCACLMVISPKFSSVLGILCACDEGVFLAGGNSLLKQLEWPAKALLLGAQGKKAAEMLIDAQMESIFLCGPQQQRSGHVSDWIEGMKDSRLRLSLLLCSHFIIQLRPEDQATTAMVVFRDHGRCTPSMCLLVRVYFLISPINSHKGSKHQHSSTSSTIPQRDKNHMLPQLRGRR